MSDRDNEGILFQCKEDSKCDYSGSARVNGKDYKLFANREDDRLVIDFLGDRGKVATVRMTALSKEERKNEKYPNSKGTLLAQNMGFEVSGWSGTYNPKDDTETTKRKISLRFKPKNQQQSKEDDDGDPF